MIGIIAKYIPRNTPSDVDKFPDLLSLHDSENILGVHGVQQISFHIEGFRSAESRIVGNVIGLWVNMRVGEQPVRGS